MATGAGWREQYSPASGNPPSTAGLGNNPSPSTNVFYETALTMEYTQDLHLKMSKKIAQLTKVSVCLCMRVPVRVQQSVRTRRLPTIMILEGVAPPVLGPVSILSSFVGAL